MARKIVFILLFLFVLLSVGTVSGVAFNQQPYNVTISCKDFDCTRTNVTILAPNSSTIAFNQSMTNRGAYASYQFTPNQVGEYSFYVFDGANFSSGTFVSSSTGTILTTANSVVYLGLFGIMIFVFFITIFFINLLPKANTRDEEGKILSISYLKYLRAPLWFAVYFLFIGILFIASNLAFAYLGEQLFATTLFTLYRILFMLSPVIIIVWIVWIFIKMFQDRQFQKMISKGIFPQRGI